MNNAETCFYHYNTIATTKCEYCKRPICLEDLKYEDFTQEKLFSTNKLTYRTNCCVVCKRARMEVENIVLNFNNGKKYDPKSKEKRELSQLREESDSLITKSFYSSSNPVVCAYHPSINSIGTCNLCHLPICQQDKRVTKFLTTNNKRYSSLYVDYNNFYCILCKLILVRAFTTKLYNENKYDLYNELNSDLNYVEKEASTLLETMAHSLPNNKSEISNTNPSKNFISCKYHSSIANTKCDNCNAPLCQKHVKNYTETQTKRKMANYYEDEVTTIKINYTICLDCYIDRLKKDRNKYTKMTIPFIIFGMIIILPGIAFLLILLALYYGYNRDIKKAKREISLARSLDVT